MTLEKKKKHVLTHWQFLRHPLSEIWASTLNMEGAKETYFKFPRGWINLQNDIRNPTYHVSVDSEQVWLLHQRVCSGRVVSCKGSTDTKDRGQRARR